MTNLSHKTEHHMAMLRLSTEQMLQDWRRMVASDYPTADLNSAIGQLATRMQEILRMGRPLP